MIPILYEKTETAFVSNGLARLRDCIEAIVVEERNGVYELDFQYPVDGANYDLIQVGRIVGVTHDESGDIQPFDIVSYTKPIDGVVTFHCTHISYRQSYITIKGSNINSLSDAFTQITTYAKPATPFTYWTDKLSTGYVGAFDGIPKTVRSVLGGTEGSLLDAYGGEYEWDKWTVKLWSARGQYRDFSIRYGVNMLDYNEEYDTADCYSSVRPYWTDGTSTVVGDKQDSGSLPPSGRDQCIPLDVSEKFETQPTKAQVEAMGMSIMLQGKSSFPSQTIDISFVRLQDLGEYADYQNLLQCRLCDTINVIFPDFNSSGTFKIVQTEWNVLTNKYESMQLGTLATTLAEALGIESGTSYGVAGASSSIPYLTCATAAATAAKTTTLVSGSFTEADLIAGAQVIVKFTNANGVASPTLSVNGTTAKAIKRYGTTAPSTSAATSWNAGSSVMFVYDGTYWQQIGYLNSTYSEISVANITNGSGSSAGTITGRRAKAAVEAFTPIQVKVVRVDIPSKSYASGNNWIYSDDVHATSVSGYTPVAVLQATPPSGAGALVIQISLDYATYGDRFVGLVRNLGSSAVTCDLTVPVLYINNNYYS